MSKEEELTQAFIEGYRIAGKEVGYWARRFLQAVKRNGGLAVAKDMLTPRTSGQRKGLDVLLEANRPELTVEAIVLRPEFRSLFNVAEIVVAEERLGEYAKAIKSHLASHRKLFPDELDSGPNYTEGAKKQVRVNAYERSPTARKACLSHHGYNCAVCKFNFQSNYGDIGKDFIHVHHLKPLALTEGAYKINAIADLRPVCPNCHAMLHSGEGGVLSIEELQSRLVHK